MPDRITVERDGHVLLIGVNRPESATPAIFPRSSSSPRRMSA